MVDIMKLPFRHGIVKYASDNNKVPKFLYIEKYDNYAQINITGNDSVLITFAHNKVNYLFKEDKSIQNAWGPFDQTIKYWLYWDLSLLTGKRTFGTTTLLPVTDYTPPEDAVNGQHWFDLTDTVMKFYEDGYWITCLRVFAGTYDKGEVIAYPLSSQVGLFAGGDAGFIMYSDYDTPHQRAQDDGSFKFLTTDLHFNDVKAVSTTVSLNSTLHFGVAGADLSKFTMVTYDENKHLIPASYDDAKHRTAVGIILHDIQNTQQCSFETNTHATNELWNWAVPSSPLYLSKDGTISDKPANTGFIQKIGFVINSNTIYIDTTYQIVYHNTFNRKVPIPLSIDKRTGKIYTSYPVTDDMLLSVHTNTYNNVYQQPVPNDTWIVKHTRALDNFLVQVYDSNGRMIIPNNISRVDKNTLNITVNKKTTGFVKLISY